MKCEYKTYSTMMYHFAPKASDRIIMFVLQTNDAMLAE